MLKDAKDRASEHASDSLRDRIWRVIFLTDTKAARGFDVVLLWLIGLSVLVVMVESVESYKDWSPRLFLTAEWIFTILFTIEYFTRIWVVRDKKGYIFSFFGIIDLISIIPTYLAWFFLGGAKVLVVVRILRLLRIFRVLKMVRHMGEANILLNAFRASLNKITVFIFFVIAITTILGTCMYVVEHLIYGNEGFSSVPQSIYWSIVTISTVGYGDVTPESPLGKLLATVIMLTGYGIIAVPTGIVTAELNFQMAAVQMDTRKCDECGLEGHDSKAAFCKMCGTEL